jgi:hypothetical protein
LRTVQIFMVRFLVDPLQPRRLMGTILGFPQGDMLAFQNDQDLIRQIYTLLENRIVKQDESDFTHNKADE